MVKNFKELIEREKQTTKKTIAIAGAGDVSTLEAVKEVESLGISKCYLIDNVKKIKESALKIGYELDEDYVIDVPNEREAAKKAVELVREGKADLPMKGNMQTGDYLRAILNKESGISKGGLLSHVSVFEKPEGGFLIITDCAMTMYPDLKEKVALIENAAYVARKLGSEVPKVAAISFVETVNPNAQSSIDAALLSKMSERGQIKGVIVDGPLALDNAISLEAAEQKNIISEVAGQADILLVPNIDVGNVLYKTLTMLAGYKAAGTIQGAAVPIIQSPRADPMESKINSIVLNQFLTN